MMLRVHHDVIRSRSYHKPMPRLTRTSLQANIYLMSHNIHGGGGPHVGEVTCGGSPHLSCKRDQIKMGDYMDRWVTLHSGQTSEICKS